MTKFQTNYRAHYLVFAVLLAASGLLSACSYNSYPQYPSQSSPDTGPKADAAPVLPNDGLPFSYKGKQGKQTTSSLPSSFGQ